MISKELLSEIYNFDVKEIIELGTDEVTYEVRFNGLKNGLKYNIINIYELAHKCKEWAWLQGFMLSSGFSDSKWFCEYLQIDNDYINDYFLSDSEPEAIFKACEWILKKESGCSE